MALTCGEATALANDVHPRAPWRDPVAREAEVSMALPQMVHRPQTHLLTDADSVAVAVDRMLVHLKSTRNMGLEQVSAKVLLVLEKHAEKLPPAPGWGPSDGSISRSTWRRYRIGATKCHPSVVRALAIAAEVTPGDMAVLNRLLSPNAPAGLRPREQNAQVLVERLNNRAVREVTSRGGRAKPLRDLYVPRTPEQPLLRDVLAGTSGCVAGEAGTGKTSLLWSLQRQLAGAQRRPIMLRAVDLMTEHGSLTPEVLDDALASPHRVRRVLLLDSVDLLLHEVADRDVLDVVISAAARRQVPVVMSCRTSEMSALDDVWTAPSRRRWDLGDYDHRELRDAVAALSSAYYRGHAEIDHRHIYDKVLQAVVDGLPLKEVCERPLTLGMLFEVAVDNEPDIEVDADELMDRFWEHRVPRDDRLGMSGEAAGSEAAADCGPVAEGVAEHMLVEGRPEALPRELASIRLRGGARRKDTPRAVRLLRSRGVFVRGGQDAPVAFFHQVVFEHAAGRLLSGMPTGGIDGLLDLLTDNPDDAYRIAVAEQALVQIGRSRAPDGIGGHLRRLLRQQESALLSLGLRVYARLWDPDADVRAVVRDTLRTCAKELAIQYLSALPATRHAVFDGRSPRLAEELRVLWGRGEPEVRKALVDVLLRLVNRMPATVAEFVDGTCADPTGCAEKPCGSADCLWSSLSTRPWAEIVLNNNPVGRLLESLAATHPDRTWNRLTHFCARAARAARPAVMARCLRLAARFVADRPAAVWEFQLKIDRLRPKGKASGAGSRDWVEVDQALAVLLAHRWRTDDLASREALLAMVRSTIGKGALNSRQRVTLLAIGECASDLTEAEATRLLDGVVDDLDQGSVEITAKVVLRRLLLRDGADEVRGWAAAALRVFADAEINERAGLAARFVRSALDHDSVPDTLVAELVRLAWPRNRPSMSDEGFWFDNKRMSALTVQAAAGGHRIAWRALKRRRQARAAGDDPGAPDVVVDRRCRRTSQRDLRFLHELLDDCLVLADVHWLAQMVDNDLHPARDDDLRSIDPRALDVLDSHIDRLDGIVDAALARRADRNLVSSALKLRIFLVTHRLGLVPPAAMLVDRLWVVKDHKLIALLLKLLQAVLDRRDAVPWTYEDRQALDDALVRVRTVAHAAGATDQPTQQGNALAKHWRAIERDCRRCAITLTARLSQLDTADQRKQAVLRIRGQIAELTDVDDLVRVRGLIESLVALDSAAAADLFVAVVERTGADSAQGYDSHAVSRLVYRWWQVVSVLVGGASYEVWANVLGRLRDGPWQLFHRFVEISTKRRHEDEVPADLKRHAGLSRHRERALPAVEKHVRLHRRQRGAPARWTGLREVPLE
ncbi:hypothetical protein [Kutzneria sp. 744]|uniref:hypothetical protein n=1 Tax=Kutzneria sp. (strain 744) TaxID=345341 RepID=UPI0003EEC38F|nr:hypothetical protein [Kutzneria sp. 744]EWM12085.1 LigA protein [Kutzneria sp. 744]